MIETDASNEDDTAWDGVPPPTRRRRRRRRLFRVSNAALALIASACVLGLLGVGFTVVPALGPALVPGHGAWTSAAGAALPVSQTLAVPGLSKPVTVSFTKQGLASINASTDYDAYLALGYVHARFRLTQLDIERRLAEGRLAQLAGPRAVGSDKFELRLGLMRTAQREWAQMPKSSPAAQAHVAYAAGVNDWLAQLRANKQWPTVFSLTGVYPANWTPVDSLAVQGAFTQELDFTTTPLDYALLERSLGVQRTMDWFPVLPPNQQSPYDLGPYRRQGLAPLSGVQLAAENRGGGQPRSGQNNPPVLTAAISAGLARASSVVLAQARSLPTGQIYSYPASNAWAANGPKVAGGGAMLGGDPHVLQTLPSVWYEVALTAPGLAVSGVSVPGLPGVMIGHNAHIAWSLTDTQSQATLFYSEQTAKNRPGQYFWRGQWRRMQVLHYAIGVRGHSNVPFAVDETVHGPVLTEAGQTVAVDWMGALGSPAIATMISVDRASNFGEFKAALAGWKSPALNFVYADDRGNIGAISAGYYPQVSHGSPWLPLSGTGADDVTGVIPYAAVPQVYDPPSHVIASANQRPVRGSYPYYIGTSADIFDPGYRADAEKAFLTKKYSMGPAKFATLQNDVGDQLASVIVPRLMAALKGTKLTPLQKQAQQALSSWNRQMDVSSSGASIWWTFWKSYLSAVFNPWWTAAKVPVHLDRSGLSVGPSQFSLDEDLEAWTVGDQQNAAFSPPGGSQRNADEVMRLAFASAVSQLAAKLGGGPGQWAWGKLHTRQFPSLTAGSALGYGPRAAGGDPWTVNAAEGGLNSKVGPSWRMIVSFTGPGRLPVAVGVYPGGQSENPASPWYTNMIGLWWTGQYLALPATGAAGVLRLPADRVAASSSGGSSGGNKGGSGGKGGSSSSSSGVGGSGKAGSLASPAVPTVEWELRP